MELTSSDFVKHSLVSFFEGSLEAVGESEVSSGTDSLLLAASLGSLLLEGGSTGLLAGLNSLGLSVAERLSSGVESLHGGFVGKRVLLALVGLVSADASHSELALDLVRVDDSGEVSAGHHVSTELEATLGDGSLSVGTEDVVELLKGILGEDDESSEVTTWGELEEVKSVDVADVDTFEVASGLLDKRVGITVDDEGTSAESETGVSQLALTGAHLLGRADTGKVAGDTDVVEGLKELAGLLNVEGVNDEGELGHVLDSVTTGHDEGSACGGGESGGNSVSLLVKIDFSLPLSPDLKGSEHATLTAHVTESTLAGTVSTGARDSGDTCDGTTSTPRLGGVLVASVPEDTVTLSSVLGHVGVAELDEIISDGGGENGGHAGGTRHLFGIGGVHTDGGTGSHCFVNSTLVNNNNNK